MAASACFHTAFSASALVVERPRGACTTASGCRSSSNTSRAPASPAASQRQTTVSRTSVISEVWHPHPAGRWRTNMAVARRRRQHRQVPARNHRSDRADLPHPALPRVAQVEEDRRVPPPPRRRDAVVVRQRPTAPSTPLPLGFLHGTSRAALRSGRSNPFGLGRAYTWWIVDSTKRRGDNERRNLPSLFIGPDEPAGDRAASLEPR